MNIKDRNILTDKVAKEILNDLEDIYNENHEELDSKECEELINKFNDYINKHYILWIK